MSINLIDAANAYGRPLGGVAPLGKSSPLGGGTSPEETGANFGDMVSNMVSSTAATLGRAETASIKQVAGKGDLIDVVTAMGAAETALDTMIAVRDKVVSAYGEIMRMQI
jgi:flagellar hook-basal body complex protein FliE